jgi:basic membrane protein A
MMAKKWYLITALLVAVAILFVAGCSGKQAQGPATPAPSTTTNGQKTIQVGFIYDGPFDDGGWNTAHYNAMLYVQKQLPSLKITNVANATTTDDFTRIATQMIQNGVNFIVASSFDWSDSVTKLAQQFPNVYFLVAQGDSTGPNVIDYDFDMNEGMYMCGQVAGKMTKTNVIGFVAANPIPCVVSAIDAFGIGIKSVNPNAKIKLLWTNTWYDPSTEMEAANSLLDEKADVLAEYQDSPAVQEAAQKRGAYSIGFHADMHRFAPQANLTSCVWNLGPSFVTDIKAAQNGTWKGNQYVYATEGAAGAIAPLYNVPPDVQQLVTATKAKLSSGQLQVFAGPINDNQGKVIAAAGTTISLADIEKCHWLFENVQGQLP